jgi:hypothetical protein
MNMHWLPRMLFNKVAYAIGYGVSELFSWNLLAQCLSVALAATMFIIAVRRFLKARGARMEAHLAAAVLFAIAIHSSELAIAADEPYRPARLADGAPDLQGIWDHTNATPLARLKGFNTLEISKEQAAYIDSIINGLFKNQNVPNDPDNDLAQRSVEPIRGKYRSSLIIDPVDGRLPGNESLTLWLRGLRASLFDDLDGPEQRPTTERCLSDVGQPPILSNPGLNLHQIVQTADMVVFHAEAMHEARIVRLNSKHAPPAITSWLGDSIGKWEGDTLVVETKNFTPSDPGRAMPFSSFRVSPRATVTERFTRVAENRIEYLYTVDDPENYTRPWTAESQLWRSNERMFEYACHEGNRSLGYILQAQRVSDGTWQESSVPTEERSR